MRLTDIYIMASRSVFGYHLRTALILLGIAIGVSAVILLAALGDSARRYVTGEFAALGTNLVIVLPGRSETTGGPPPLLGETPRDLTIDDALALSRSVNINELAPIMVGTAPASWQGLEREVMVIGSTASMQTVRQLELAQGRFLPKVDPHRSISLCVIGKELKDELFGNQSALGEWLRIGDRRFRVIGVLKESGVSIGVDFDDMVIVPVASTQALFDSPSLFRILVEAKSPELIEAASNDIRRIIKDRHEGEDDVTIITQDSVIATFDKIFSVLTYGVAGIAAISLFVAGILIMNIMLVAVSQRRVEIGLLKALGASNQQVQSLFLAEAALLSFFGTLLGVILAMFMIEAIHRIYPTVPVSAPPWAVLAAITIALATGILFGVLPAHRAARLDPVIAWQNTDIHASYRFNKNVTGHYRGFPTAFNTDHTRYSRGYRIRCITYLHW